MISTTLPTSTEIAPAAGAGLAGFTRAAFRLIGMAAGSAARYLLWFAGDLARTARPEARRIWRAKCVRGWGRATARAAGVRLHVSGKAPAAPFLLVSNHLGYLDIIVLAAVADGRFVARHDLGDWPLIGRLVRAGGTILIRRDLRADTAAASAAMRAAFDEGSGVILFPEGTSSSGHDVLPFRTSLFEPAVALAMPVHTAALAYSTPEDTTAPGDSVCWWGDMKFAPHLWRLLQLGRIEAHVAFGDEPIVGSERKQLSAAAHDAVVSLHASLRAEVQ